MTKKTAIASGISMLLTILAVLSAPVSSAQDSYFGSTTTRGVTSTATPAGAPEATPADGQNSAADILKTYHASLDFISGKEMSGNGFIVSLSGSNYLVTNAHVAIALNDAAFKGHDGVPVRGTPSVAVGEDIFRMEAPAGGKPFELMQGVDQNAAIGDAVVVLGNTDDGVINPIVGKIIGIGPNLVEVDAPFVEGNSGSPIIHLKSGKVIGVATYLTVKSYDETTKEKAKAPVIRRFGYRLDSVKTWQPVNWQAYYAQAVMMRNIQTLTNDLDDFFSDLEQNGHITPGRHTNPVIKTRIDQWLASGNSQQSDTDAANNAANFIAFLKVACMSDVNAAQRYMTYDYFQRTLGDELQVRGEMAKAFEQMINGIQGPSQGAAASSGFSGTVWETPHDAGSGDFSRITFRGDGTWQENWHGITHRGHWKPTDYSKVVEIQLVSGDNVNGHGVIHYQMSDDGATCFRQEEKTTWDRKNE